MIAIAKVSTLMTAGWGYTLIRVFHLRCERFSPAFSSLRSRSIFGFAIPRVKTLIGLVTSVAHWTIKFVGKELFYLLTINKLTHFSQ